MAKAVFTIKIQSKYDDLPEDRYHFPRTYLNAVKQTVGDYIVYYEPSRLDRERKKSGGRMAYFALAQVETIQTDPLRENHYYARIKPGSYLEFPSPVPYREGDLFYESSLRKEDGSHNVGLFQRSVRLLGENEFDLIVRRAFIDPSHVISPESSEWEVQEEPGVYERPIVQQLTNRMYRDSAFSNVIRQAYDSTCAITGLRLINGGGNCEMEAAHIRPVHDYGPDSPRNGIALSRTVHWMFDRGIISLEDDGKILKADSLIPDEYQRFFHPSGFALLPDKLQWQPHPQYLRFHRESIFKG